jgi:hypothetical protein
VNHNDLKILFKPEQYPRALNYLSDDRFKIKGIETMTDGVGTQKLDNVETIFSTNTITIRYTINDSIIAFLILSIRISDPYFKCIEVECEGVFEFHQKMTNITHLYNLLFDKIYNNNSITIRTDEGSTHYAIGVLLCKQDSKHDSRYYFLKEYQRWIDLNFK